MASLKHLAILQQGVNAWNAWRDEYPLIEIDLGEADLHGMDLHRINFRRVNLWEANLYGADLRHAGLREANFHHANLRNANLQDAHLSQADLSRTDLRDANLHNANFHMANFHNSHLHKSDLSSADFSHADLSKANLHGANLVSANLHGANLSGADLSQANLSGAYLTATSLIDTNLNGTSLADATFGYTKLAGLNLSSTKGLESARHTGPSNISIDTLILSKGNIPEVFLRGIGIPEPFVTNMKALIGAMDPIQFYSCFISYSNKDESFAQRLYADLQAKGVRCFYAPEDLKIGSRFRDEIERSIHVHDKLLLALSSDSIQSRWVQTEVETAFEREQRENRSVLFPIRLDATVMETKQAWAAEIRRTRHIGDFSRWKDHGSYQKAFDRLMRDLKATQPAP